MSIDIVCFIIVEEHLHPNQYHLTHPSRRHGRAQSVRSDRMSVEEVEKNLEAVHVA